MEATYDSAIGRFSKKERQSHDTFEAGFVELEPAVVAKRTALLSYKREPSENDAQRIARRCANDYWRNLCQSIQFSAHCGNTRAMYNGMKRAFGPSVTKIAPLKAATGVTITYRVKQMQGWAEHYQLYSRETIVTETSV